MCNDQFMGLVSVIVPVYQAQQYIHKCVDSIASQDYKEIEILLVDDGSTDNSRNICEQLSSVDDRIKLIHKENGGASSARNLGLANAKGKWVVFVDSDDTIDSDLVSTLVKSENGADFVMSGLNILYESTTKSIKTPDKMYSPTSLMNELDKEYSLGCFCGPYCKLYKKSIIDENKLRFDESISMCEDLLFILSYLEYCTTIASISYCGYNYVKTNPNSVMSVFNAKHYDMRMIAFKKMIDSSIAWKCSDDTIERVENLYTFSLFNVIRQGFNKKCKASFKQKRGLVKRFLNDGIVNKSLASNKDKYLLYKMLRLFSKYKTVDLMYIYLCISFSFKN